MKRAAATALVAALCACPRPDGPAVLLDFGRRAALFSAPFPADDLLAADGTIDLSLVPRRNVLVEKTLALLQGRRGFSLAGAVFFPLNDSLGEVALPKPEGSLAADAPVALVAVANGERVPLDVAFLRDGGPYGAPNLLALLPVQGYPLRPDTEYLAVVRRTLRDAKGRDLAPMPAAKAALLKAALGLHPDQIAGYTFFRTGDPEAEIEAVRADALTRAAPLPAEPPQLRATHPDYCLFGATVQVPVYQRGVPPYGTSGGGWTFDAQGKPVLQRFEEANLFVTVPRAAMPAEGWPIVVYVRAGGGGEAPLADRGPHATNMGTSPPGTGLAKHIAQAGFAAVQLDGPLGGRRNTTHADEQFTVFNVTNPEALRDNVRQTAVELSALIQSLHALSFPTASCAGAPAQFAADTSRLAIFGHSTGATIAPLVLASEPRLKAAVLSGAGGSWIENVVEKQKPLDVRPIAELLLGYTELGRTLTRHDPVLTFFQWALEPADPQVYARRVLREPRQGHPARHVLMIQGVVDRYIRPRIANATSAGIGLDLAGPVLDDTHAELRTTMPALAALRLGAGGSTALPASGNRRDGTVTAVVVQHAEDGIEDGHEVLFQAEAPQRQLRCFLSTFARGLPGVPAAAPLSAPCD